MDVIGRTRPDRSGKARAEGQWTIFDPDVLAEWAYRVPPPVLGHMPRWARILIRRANAITPEPGFSQSDMIMVWERCEGSCAVSGLPFSLIQIGNGRARRPFAPSLDQIDPGRGYTPDNVRLVCVAANFGMNAWGQDVYLHVARGAVAKIDSRGDADEKAWYARQDAKIEAAVRELRSLSGEALIKQRHRLASLRRARRLGPAGLQRAAQLAVMTRKSGAPPVRI